MKRYFEASLLAGVLAIAACSGPQSSTPAQTPVASAAGPTASAPPATGATAAATPAAVAAPAAPPSPAPAAASAPITLTADDAAKLKAWIVAQNTPSAALPGAVLAGYTMPLEVPLHAIPASVGVPAAGTSQYGVISNTIVLVDPHNYRILYVFK